MTERVKLRDAWRRSEKRPLCIAHRGASAHAPENTLAAFALAAEMGAEMWEIDLWHTADGALVVSHDGDLMRLSGKPETIRDITRARLAELAPDIPDFADVIALARATDCALYVEIKGQGTGLRALAALRASGFVRAAIGSFDPAEVRSIHDAGCEYPLSVLVRSGADPFVQADLAGADCIHLCWERASDRPQDLVTPTLLAKAQEKALDIVLWHEERPSILADLERLPVLGICTNNPELMRGVRNLTPALPFAVAAMRGAARVAPENTLAAVRVAFDQGAAYAMVDLRTTGDGVLVALADPKLDRTTSGEGPLAGMTWREVQTLDAGSKHGPLFAGERVPSLAALIVLAQSRNRGLIVHLRSVDADEVVRVVTACGFLEGCIFASTDPAVLNKVMMSHGRATVLDLSLQAKHVTGDVQGCGQGAGSWDDLAGQAVTWFLRTDGAAGGQQVALYTGDNPLEYARIIAAKPDLAIVAREDVLRAAWLAQAGA